MGSKFEYLEQVFSPEELSALIGLRPKRSYRSWQITNAAQACVLSIGCSWGKGQLTSVRLGEGVRYLAIPFLLEKEQSTLVVGLRFSREWEFERYLFADFHWLKGTQFPNFGMRDREWAWLAYARVALSEKCQIKPVFSGKAKTSYHFLEL